MPQLRSRLAVALALAALHVGLPALAVNPRTHRVNEVALTGSDVAIVPAPAFSPDGEWVVYLHDADVNDEFQLWAARRWAGSVPVRLSNAFTNVVDFEIARNSRRVVYLADEDAAGVFELFSVPIDGAAAPVQLNPNATGERDVVGFEIARNSARVVLKGDLLVDGRNELWSVPLGGPASAADKLSQNPVGAFGQVGSFLITRDSARVVFTGALNANEVDEVWSAPLAGPLGDEISPLPAAGATGVIESAGLELRASESGSRVVFAGEFNPVGAIKLYTVPAAGPRGAADPLHGDPVTGGGPAAFAIARDAPGVVFTGDLLVAGRIELFSAALDGTGSAERLSHATLQSAGDVTDFEIGPGASPRVVFRADALVEERFDLYQVPASGAVGPTRLNVINAAAGDVAPDFAIALDGARVVFRGNNTNAARIELYSAATNGGSGSAIRLSPTTPITGANVDAFAISRDSTRVVLRGNLDVNDRVELFSAPIAASNQMVKLHPDAGLNEEVTDFALACDGLEVEIVCDGARVALLADFTVNGRYALWTAPVAGPAGSAVQAHAEAVTNGDAVAPLVWSEDGLGVLFPGDLDFDERYHLWDADELVFRADHEEGDTSEWSAALP